MKLSPDKIQRLIFVRYLLGQAEQQKNAGPPLSSTAILTLHDLVEMFLQLALEHLAQKVRVSNQNILDTSTDAINEILSDRVDPTINKAFIKRLNELRRQLKHTTIFVERGNIESLFSETQTFLSDFTEIIFKCNISEVSLIQLIPNETMRDYLNDAEKLLNDNEFALSLGNIAKAFHVFQSVIDIKDRYGRSILRGYVDRVQYSRTSHLTIGGRALDPVAAEALRRIADDIKRIKEDVLTTLELQLLRVDIREYLLFREIVPAVFETHNKETGPKLIIPAIDAMKKEKYQFTQVRFCLDFLINAALSFNYARNTKENIGSRRAKTS